MKLFKFEYRGNSGTIRALTWEQAYKQVMERYPHLAPITPTITDISDRKVG